jgi:DNA repair protein RadB
MTEKILTGSFDLNDFLEGGYESDVISMIAGPPGSGKTNLAILAACSLANKDKKVIFIDTEGGFSVERVKQIVGDSYGNVLKNILLLEPTSFEEQKKSFGQLVQNVKKGHVDLIVIDSMAMLYRLELAGASKKDDYSVKEVNRELAEQMKFLSDIARKQKIPVLIVNQVYSSFVKGDAFSEKQVNIVGGDLFGYWSKCILELKKQGSKRKLILRKHRNLPEKEMGFEIREKGIFKKRGLF